MKISGGAGITRAVLIVVFGAATAGTTYTANQHSGCIAAEQVMITAADGVVDDLFGCSLAVQGDTVVVGAKGDADLGPATGAVYVFQDVSTDGDWSSYTETKITAATGLAGARFGAAVAMHDDTIAVGAVGMGAFGVVYIYRDESPAGDWSSYNETVIVCSTCSGISEYFGRAVAIPDSGTVLIGYPAQRAGGSFAGALFIVHDTSAAGDWSSYSETRFMPADIESYDWFGIAVAAAGDTAVATSKSGDAGAAYVLRDTSATGDWSEISQTKLTSSDGGSLDFFGDAVALQGSTVVVGAPGWDGFAYGSYSQGAAYVFQDTSTSGDWSSIRETRLVDLFGRAYEYFGTAVALSDNTVVVGSIGDTGAAANSGTAFFISDSGSDGDWSRLCITKSVPDSLDENLDYGFSAAMDGALTAVGAPGSMSNRGAVYLTLEMQAGGSAPLCFVESDHDGEPGIEGLDGPRSVVVSNLGRHVYTTGQWDNAVTTFTSERVSGHLSWLESEVDGASGVDGLAEACSVTLSPDGLHAYVAGKADSAVAAFNRDLATGGLSFIEAELDGVGGVDGLAGARTVVVSPDGGHVYVAGYDDDAVAGFARDPVTGALNFVEMQQDGVGGVDGLDNAAAVATSPDGEFLYATGHLDDAVVVFDRDPATGTLTFVQVLKDGIDGVSGLDGARAVAVRPAGDLVVVCGELSNAVAVFERDQATGVLTFTGTLANGTTVTRGLTGAWAAAWAPSGRLLYLTGDGDDAVVVFEDQDDRLFRDGFEFGSFIAWRAAVP